MVQEKRYDEGVASLGRGECHAPRIRDEILEA